MTIYEFGVCVFFRITIRNMKETAPVQEQLAPKRKTRQPGVMNWYHKTMTRIPCCPFAPQCCPESIAEEVIATACYWKRDMI